MGLWIYSGKRNTKLWHNPYTYSTYTYCSYTNSTYSNSSNPYRSYTYSNNCLVLYFTLHK